MKRKLKLIISFLAIPILCLTGFFISSLISQPNKSDNQSSGSNLRWLQNEAFGYGEKFEYDVKYSFITAGEGTIQVMPKPAYRNNRECYDVRFEARSLKSLEFLYKVKDNYSSILDASGIFPWEFEQHIREGGYKRDFKAVFDQYNNYAYANSKKYKMTPYIHDIISAFYYVRTLNLGRMRKDSVLYMRNFWDDTTYKLGVKYLGKANVEVPCGKFRCVVIEPLVVQGGLFKSEGQIFIYLTDDERKMPVKVSAKILIGSVSAELTSYKGLRGPLNSILQ